MPFNYLKIVDKYNNRVNYNSESDYKWLRKCRVCGFETILINVLDAYPLSL